MVQIPHRDYSRIWYICCLLDRQIKSQGGLWSFISTYELACNPLLVLLKAQSKVVKSVGAVGLPVSFGLL